MISSIIKHLLLLTYCRLLNSIIDPIKIHLNSEDVQIIIQVQITKQRFT